jgi:cell division protein FtsI (penicillin-binding protein 3)
MKPVLQIDFASVGRSAQSSRVKVNRAGRTLLLAAFALCWCVLVITRLVSLQITDFERWQEWALKQHFSEITIASERATITDRNGKLIAVSVPAASIYARPKQIRDQALVVRELAKVLGENPKLLEKKLRSGAPFIWLKRQIPRHQANQVAALKIAGVGQVIESRRYYPYNEAASTLIGRVGVDGNGLSGLESIYEKDLRGTQRKARVNRDALGNFIETSQQSEQALALPQGEEMRLTLDADLQMIVDEELEAGRVEANAKGAMAVLIDADTGEVLSMSQSPSANFNLAEIPSARALRNQIIETVFEPGSTMKPIVAAGAIEAGVVSSRDMLDCEHGAYRVGKHTIKDVHPSGVISAFDVVVRSSNIGMTKMGMRMGADRLYDFLRDVGFGSASGLGLPGETKGIFRSVKGWAQIDVATHSFGQGIAVTPLQMVRAVSAIANGGLLPELSIIKGPAQAGRRIFSERTSDVVREMMFGVVEDEHGTGHNAQIEGVRIGGKTGTAQKARSDGKGYAQGLYVASFVGFAEASALGLKRRLTLFVMIDEPHARSIYGGTLAAPVFKRIMQRTLHYLATARAQSKNPQDSLVPDGNLPANKSLLTQVVYHS